jgi:hypothetical protein
MSCGTAGPHGKQWQKFQERQLGSKPNNNIRNWMRYKDLYSMKRGVGSATKQNFKMISSLIIKLLAFYLLFCILSLIFQRKTVIFPYVKLIKRSTFAKLPTFNVKSKSLCFAGIKSNLNILNLTSTQLKIFLYYQFVKLVIPL